jgi:hypothetical protein
MKSKILHLLLMPLFLALVLTDCAAQTVPNDDEADPGNYRSGRMPAGLSVPASCPGTDRPIRGSSLVLVKYGDSYLEVTSHAQVARKNDKGVGAIEFKLTPIGGAVRETAVVTIIGKRPPSKFPNASVSWLHALGRGKESLVVCPDDDTPNGEYKYEVSVEGVGTLDPRAEVIDG